MTEPTHVAVIGGGPAGLMAAEVIAGNGWPVTVYDRMPTVGRKLLLAGRGGLNLTHSEDFERFVSRYREATDQLRPALKALPPTALRTWAADLGEETFVGSSGRVFPKSFKTSPLLRAWLRRLDGLGVGLEPRTRLVDFAPAGGLVLEGPDGVKRTIRPAAAVLALGGASWPRLGSDGGWVPILEAAGVPVAPLAPANCGFEIAWSEIFRSRSAGEPLKRIAIRFEDRTVKGEGLVTEEGLEGGAVYALSAEIRAALDRSGPATISVDLKPGMSTDEIAAALARGRKGDTLSNRLRKAAGLPPVAIGLLREGSGRDLPGEPAALAALIKAVPLVVAGARPIEKAISSAGGIRLDAVDEHCMLKALPGVFAAGEMLDWEAPTGGYLLQATFATGAAAGRGAIAWLAETGR